MNPILHGLRFLVGTIVVCAIIAISYLADAYTDAFMATFMIIIIMALSYLFGLIIVEGFKPES